MLRNLMEKPIIGLWQVQVKDVLLQDGYTRPWREDQANDASKDLNDDKVTKIEGKWIWELQVQSG